MNKNTDLVAPLKAAMQREFRSERILWSGCPDPRRAFFPSMAIWLFAVPWTAFALFWEGTAIAQLLRAIGQGHPWQAGNWLMLLWGLPFLAIGLAMMSAPWYARWQARRSIYALGETRLVHLRLGFKALVVRSTGLKQISTIERSEWPDGSGSLKISLGHSRDSDGDLVERWEKVEHVADVRRLEDLLVEARERTSPSARY